MKIVQIGRNLINLDKVIYLSLDNNKLTLEGDVKIELSGQEIDDFIFNYNLYDTDETKTLLERVARVVLSNPEYLTKEGIQEQITIKVKYHQLEDYFKEISEGVKLKELPLNKLLNIYRLIMDKVKEIEKDLPY